MNRTILSITLIAILSMGLIGCQLETAVAQVTDRPLPSPVVSTAESQHSQPRATSKATCHQWKEQILATTIRLQMKSWVEFDLSMGREPISHEAISHATVVGGRYLVTHNHFKISPTYQGNGTSLHATLYDAAGKMLVEAANFSVAWTEAETLLLEFSDEEGRGLFDTLGIPSAQMLTGGSLPLGSGMTVAQVSWDGSMTHVNCVPIESLVIDEGTPSITLRNGIQPGSSGGGVFWQGYHVANNWQRTTLRASDSSTILRQFSRAALNSPSLIMAGNATAQAVVTVAP